MSDKVSNEELIVYSAKVCPFAQRTLILLNLKKLDYRLVAVDLNNKSEEFLKLSPYGKVPLIKLGDKVVY